jgi:protein-S-isoprenylcysteine O-methyltransferase Ste14
MKSSALEFRLRMLINAIIIVLGYWAPWIEGLGIGRRIPLLEWLPLELSRLGLLSFSVAAPVVIVAGAFLAAIGAILRVWGTAWLGPGTVIHSRMKAGTVMADGPYRFVRNPLYIGLLFWLAAMTLLMPPTGALFVLIVVPVFLLRLILGEETFLAAQLGEPYRNYLRAVPRLIPQLRSSLPPSGQRPRWLIAALSELNPIGVFLTLAVLSWNYDYRLMLRAIIVTFGVNLIARAIIMGKSTAGLEAAQGKPHNT